MARFEAPRQLNCQYYGSTKTCAISTLHGFFDHTNPMYLTRLEADLKGYTKASRDATFGQSISVNVASTLTCSLNEDQRKVCEGLLLQYGFTRVSSFRNHRENNTCHIYIFCASPEADESMWSMNYESEDEDEDSYEEGEEEE